MKSLQAEAERLRDGIHRALNADGVNEDDCPLVPCTDAEARAWVEGYETGQDSIAEPLQAYKVAAQPPQGGPERSGT